MSCSEDSLVVAAAAADETCCELGADIDDLQDDDESAIVVIDNASCGKRMSGAKTLRELVLTLPSLNIYANIGFTVKNIQHEAKFVNLGNGNKRPIAMILLVCDTQHTEILRSIAEIQEKFGEVVYAEVKVTTPVKSDVLRLDVFSGRIDLAAQLRSNVLEEDVLASVALRIRLPHLISGDCEQAKVSRVFNYLTTPVIAEMIKKAFDE